MTGRRGWRRKLLLDYLKEKTRYWRLKEEATDRAVWRKGGTKDRVTGRRGWRRKLLLDYLKEKTRYWRLKEEAIDRAVWRTRCGRGCGPLVRYRNIWSYNMLIFLNRNRSVWCSIIPLDLNSVCTRSMILKFQLLARMFYADSETIRHCRPSLCVSTFLHRIIQILLVSLETGKDLTWNGVTNQLTN